MQQTAAIDERLKVIEDNQRVRATLQQVRDAYKEVSLSELMGGEIDWVPQERRQARRAQLQVPVTITPVDWSSEDDEMIIVRGEEQVGVTRDISPTGVGLTHDQVLGSDAAIVQIDLPDVGPVHLLLDLRWSVRKSRYSYTSGGRVVGLIDL